MNRDGLDMHRREFLGLCGVGLAGWAVGVGIARPCTCNGCGLRCLQFSDCKDRDGTQRRFCPHCGIERHRARHHLPQLPIFNTAQGTTRIQDLLGFDPVPFPNKELVGSGNKPTISHFGRARS